MYGDNPDANVLERAVRWVIILLVIVFDPLAIMLVLAANASKEWDDEDDATKKPVKVELPEEPAAYEPDDGPLTPVQIEQIKETAPKPVQVEIEATAEEDEAFSKISATVVPVVERTPSIEEQMADTVDPVHEPVVVARPPEFEAVKIPGTDEWIQTGPAIGPAIEPIVFHPTSSSSFKDVGDGYVEFEGKKMSKRVLMTLRPDLFNLKEDNPREIAIGFGSSLPGAAKMGDTYVKTDQMPHVVYKNNGSKWIEINKLTTGAYLSNTMYLQFLMEQISTGEYDPELLTDFEQDAITTHIKVS
jgi:hypothetical protein